MRPILRFWRAYGDALGLVGLAAALFAVATNTQTGWLFLFCAFLLAAIGLHLGMGWRELRGVEIRLVGVSPARPKVGEECEWTFSVTAPRALFRYPLIVEVPPLPFEEAAKGRFRGVDSSPQLVRCMLTASRRGPVLPGEIKLSVQSWAPFAWFATRREIVVALDEVLIYPTGPSLHAQFQGQGSGSQGATALSRRNGTWGDLRSLREYAPGDDPRSVHWPTTARLGRLVVREHAQEASQSLRVLLDLQSDSPAEAFEEMIGWTASLLDWGNRQNLLIELWTNAASSAFAPASGDPLEVLARAHPRVPLSELPDFSQDSALAISLRSAAARPPVGLWSFPSHNPESDFRRALGRLGQRS